MKEEKIFEKLDGKLRSAIIKYSDVEIEDTVKKYGLSGAKQYHIRGVVKKLIKAKGPDKWNRIDRIILGDKVYEGLDLVMALKNDDMMDDVNKLIEYYNKYPDYVSDLIKVRVINMKLTDILKNLDISNKEFYDYLRGTCIETKVLFEKLDSNLVLKLKEKGLYELGLFVFNDILANHVNYNIVALKSATHNDKGKSIHLCYECDYAHKCAKVSAPDWSVNNGYLTSKGMAFYDEIVSGVESIKDDEIERQFISGCSNFNCRDINPKRANVLDIIELEEEEKRLKRKRETIQKLREIKAMLKEAEPYSKIIEVKPRVTIKILK